MKQTEKINGRVAANKKRWEDAKKQSTNPSGFSKAPGSRNRTKLKGVRAEGERGKRH